MGNNFVENVLLQKYLYPLIDGMYWNNYNKKILVYVKANVNPQIVNPDLLVSALLKMENYDNDFWFMSSSFDINLIEKLIENGFIILGGKNYINKYNKKWMWDKKFNSKKYFSSMFMIFAMIYNKYQVLCLNNVYEPKNALRLLDKYELKINTDFDKVIDKCSEIHGEGWLTKKMRNCFKKLYRINNDRFKFISFSLYRNNQLKAGEFGCIIGKMYFSYSGYHEESGSGIIQLIKMFRYLKNTGIDFCNFFGASEHGGDKYKYKFGVKDISREEYFELLKS